MIFVRCKGGISHNPAESITEADAGAGFATLIRTVQHLIESGMTLPSEMRQAVLADIDARSGEREAFLARLVQTPSSNPPGDCAPIAEVAAGLLEGLGFDGRAACRAGGRGPRASA